MSVLWFCYCFKISSHSPFCLLIMQWPDTSRALSVLGVIHQQGGLKKFLEDTQTAALTLLFMLREMMLNPSSSTSMRKEFDAILDGVNKVDLDVVAVQLDTWMKCCKYLETNQFMLQFQVFNCLILF